MSEERVLASFRPGQFKTARMKAQMLATELDEMANDDTAAGWTFTEEHLRCIAALLRELLRHECYCQSSTAQSYSAQASGVTRL